MLIIFVIDSRYNNGIMIILFKLSRRQGERMDNMDSKSQFKLRASYYFREVEKSGKNLIISGHGKPVIKIVPYTEYPETALEALRDTVIDYKEPTEPVSGDECKT